MSTKPTILFVHGGWHTSDYFGPIRSKLEALGYPTIAPDLPFELEDSLAKDVECIATILKRLVHDEGKEVLVAPASYGTVVVTQAVTIDYKKSKGSESGGVIGILYMGGFIVPVGQSMFESFQGEPQPFIRPDGHGYSTADDPAYIFYNDVPVEEQPHWVSFLRKWPLEGPVTPLTNAAYLHFPSWIVYGTEDHTLSYLGQKRLTAQACMAGAVITRWF